MFNIRQFADADIDPVSELLQSAYKRTNEVEFLKAIRNSDTYIPELSLVAVSQREIIGYTLLTRIGIRTANEILPTLTINPFCVQNARRSQGIGRKLLDTAIEKASRLGFMSCISLQCGEYFKNFGFMPAREEFGLELYFNIKDEDFRALELSEDSLYRKSGFLLFPPEFSNIDPAIIS